jgi:hypothetical protein
MHIQLLVYNYNFLVILLIWFLRPFDKIKFDIMVINFCFAKTFSTNFKFLVKTIEFRENSIKIQASSSLSKPYQA